MAEGRMDPSMWFEDERLMKEDIGNKPDMERIKE